jgi:hypothetical protein
MRFITRRLTLVARARSSTGKSLQPMATEPRATGGSLEGFFNLEREFADSNTTSSITF